jgi:alpha-galactosidase
MNHSSETSGVELDPSAPPSAPQSTFSFVPGSSRLIQVVLRDQTDAHAELVQELEWLLHPSGSPMQLQGNVFVLENVLDGSGTIFVKLAALPDARAVRSEWDVRTHKSGAFELGENDGYPWRTATFKGGKWARIAALHRLQREIRPYDKARDGLLLTNTWGDRNRDAHLNPTFMAREIACAARLGADIVQIDDGWQRGITANSAKAQGNGQGRWNGFWEQDDGFWEVNRERFPEGLEPLFEQARTQNLRVGLWFAPDSSNEAANWERDAKLLLRHHRELGVDFFKIDGLKITTPQSEQNLQKLFARVRAESHGAVTFDHDITAEQRFGYFGLIESGPLFVENRYTDWHNHWPHHTLRVAWQLAHWIDPVRLRLEWLNNARNTDKYANDPLAPANYRPDALFAIVMMCSPLGWFENQNLPQSYFEEAAPLIAKWKVEREAMQLGTILPVGKTPDGNAWTGFVTIAADQRSGYGLLFRELNESPNYELPLPLCDVTHGEVEVLGGEGTATLQNGTLQVEIPEKLRFLWIKFRAGS